MGGIPTGSPINGGGSASLGAAAPGSLTRGLTDVIGRFTGLPSAQDLVAAQSAPSNNDLEPGKVTYPAEFPVWRNPEFRNVYFNDIPLFVWQQGGRAHHVTPAIANSIAFGSTVAAMATRTRIAREAPAVTLDMFTTSLGSSSSRHVSIDTSGAPYTGRDSVSAVTVEQLANRLTCVGALRAADRQRLGQNAPVHAPAYMTVNSEGYFPILNYWEEARGGVREGDPLMWLVTMDDSPYRVQAPLGYANDATSEIAHKLGPVHTPQIVSYQGDPGLPVALYDVNGDEKSVLDSWRSGKKRGVEVVKFLTNIFRGWDEEGNPIFTEGDLGDADEFLVNTYLPSQVKIHGLKFDGLSPLEDEDFEGTIGEAEKYGNTGLMPFDDVVASNCGRIRCFRSGSMFLL